MQQNSDQISTQSPPAQEEQKTHEFARFMENVKQQSLTLEGKKPAKTPKKEYNVQAAIPRVFQNNLRDFAIMRNGGLPRGFENFVMGQLCFDLCGAILDYCKYLVKLEKKKMQLEADAKLRSLPSPRVLRNESDKLNAKAKLMGRYYSKLLFTHRSIGSQDERSPDSIKGYIKFRAVIQNNSRNDQAFYNCVVRLYGKVLAENFPKADLPTVIMELERLFKTNLFNETSRSQERAALDQRYPQMREFTDEELNFPKKREDSLRPIKQRLQQRLDLREELVVLPDQKFRASAAYSPKGEIRPLFVNLTAQSAARGRSPLISLMFPTVKDQVCSLATAKPVNQSELRMSEPLFLPNIDLENMVKKETRNRYSQIKNFATIQ